MTTTTPHLKRYQARFSQWAAQGRKAFIPFTLLGWPDKATSLEVVQTMIESGVTALELGFPFSDPASDGPVIQKAAMDALENGFTVQDGFDMLREIRRMDAKIPIGLLVYYNIILAQGIAPFFQAAAEAGVDAVLIADLPPECADEVYPIAQACDVELIFIVSPLTSSARLKTIERYAGGFLYVVSRLGITGTDEKTDTHLADLILRLKQETRLPVCVGFGISSPEQAAKMYQYGADGVITGSKIIQIVSEATGVDRKIVLTSFLQRMLNDQ